MLVRSRRILSSFEKKLTAIKAEACRFLSNCPSRGPEKNTFIFYNPNIKNNMSRENNKNVFSQTVSASHKQILMTAKKQSATTSEAPKR